MSVSDEEVKRARDVVAELIATHSSKYLPLFEILDAEVKQRERRANLVCDTLSKLDLVKLRSARRTRQKNRRGRGG